LEVGAQSAWIARQLKNFGRRLPATVTATFGKRALAMVPPMLQAALIGLLEQIDALGKQIQDYGERIAQAGARHLAG
jgi:hypothetical protein